MASIHKEPNGTRRILFVASDGVRRCVRLGRASGRIAEGYKSKIETIIACQRAGRALDAETAEWLGEVIDDRLHQRLVKVGLAAERMNKAPATITLGKFLDQYIDLREDIKPGTHTNYLQTRRWLVEYFGEDKPLSAITQGDAEELRSYFTAKKLGENTLRRHLKRAGQFFRHALRKKYIKENPFGEMKSLSVRGNREKFYFITEQEAQKVLAACPDSQWRLLFTLSRYGGLRCPSEHLALKWANVDWARNRLTVPSPKTERHEGKASRVIPLFPELRQELEEAFDPENVYIITKYREPNVNMRTQLLRIINRAGLKPWPKLFHNLRATRQTELAQQFPAHVVSDWLGNSIAVGMEHYLRTLDSDFERAVKHPVKASQNPSQSGAERHIEMQQTKNASPTQGEAFLELASSCTGVQNDKVTLGRFEPPF